MRTHNYEARKYKSAEEFVKGKITELDKALFEGDRKTWMRLDKMRDWAFQDAGLDVAGKRPKTLTIYRMGTGEIKVGDYVATDSKYAEEFYKTGRTLLKKENVPIRDLKAFNEARIIGKNRYTGNEGVELIYDPKSQLTDFYNQAVAKPTIPKELEPLAREARKYKSAEELANSKKTYFRGGEGNNWITPDKNFASEYGEVSRYKLSPNANLLDAQMPLADEIASKFLGEPVEDSLGATDLWYQPDKKFSDFLRKEGYDGFINDKNIYIANKERLLSP